MNKKLVICLFLSVFLFSCSFANEEISELILVSSESWFSDFEVKEDQVDFYCTVCIENTTSRKEYILLYGDFEKDVEGGLVKEEIILAHENASPQITTFEVLPGKNIFQIVFTGTFAGTMQKQNRLLPEITITGVED